MILQAVAIFTLFTLSFDSLILTVFKYMTYNPVLSLCYLSL